MTKRLVEKLMAHVGEIPRHADVLEVHQRPVDELQSRARRFLTVLGEAFGQSLQREQWTSRGDQTLVQMPLSARAHLFHASGSLRVQMGLKPMESLFSKMAERESLTKIVEEVTTRIKVHEFLSSDTALKFEHLWMIKAAAAARDGNAVKPVLCRAVGAYRHFIDGMPVWGPASLAVQVAGQGQLDSLTFQVRETTGKVVDRPAILRPERAAQQIVLELQKLMGKSKLDLDDAVRPEWLRFGYLTLPKRMAQAVLAPMYVASLKIEGQPEAQAYVLAVPATDVAYLPLPAANEAPRNRMRPAASAAALP